MSGPLSASPQPTYHRRLNTSRLVYLVHDDTAVVEQITTVLRLEGFQTRIFFNYTQFRDAIEVNTPDAVLLASIIGAESGLTYLRHTRSRHPTSPCFFLLKKPDVDTAVAAMKMGASDVLGQPIDAEHLVTTIVSELRKDVTYGASVNGVRTVVVRGFSSLTKREREVLQLITQGNSNKMTAQQLAISDRTVEVHRARCMEKLGARNLADLMRIVLAS
jgi:two-component system, LuxR family, response regulator FixJ